MNECKTGMGFDRQQKLGYLLIVDSDLNELLYTSMLLQRFDYNSCTATNGEDAFQMANTAVPALILITPDLPDISGTDLILRFKQHSRTSSVPILVKVDKIIPAVEQQYHTVGASGLLSSPVTADDLFQLVQKMIETAPRSNIRIRTRLPVVMNGKQLDCGIGECVSELSEFGMYIRTSEQCPPSTRIPVKISLKDRLIALEGEVLYCHLKGEGPFLQPGMGVKFANLSEDDRKFLKSYIREEIMKGLPGRT